MGRLVRHPTLKVPGSGPGANGIIGRVLNVGAASKQVAKARSPAQSQWTPNARPPGNPTGRGTTTG
jgi:hypothetical protein